MPFRRTILLTLLLAMLLSAMVIVGGLWRVLSRQVENHWRIELPLRARILAHHLDDRLKVAEEKLLFLSQVPGLAHPTHVEAIDRAWNGIPEGVDPDKRRLLDRFLANAREFSVVFLLLPNGDHYLSHPMGVQKSLKKYNLSDRPYFRWAREGRRPVQSDGFIGADGVPAMAMDVPVPGRDGEILSHLGGVMHLSHLSGLLDRSHIGEMSEAMLVDRNRRLLAHSDPTRIQKEALREVTGLPPPSGDGREANAGFLESWEGGLAYFTPLASGWGLILIKEIAELEGGIRPVLFIVSALVGVVLAAIGGGAFFMVLRTLRQWESAEEKARAVEVKLRHLTDAIPGAVFQVSMDDHGKNRRFLFMSEGGQELLGLPAAEMVRDFDLAWSMVHPGDQEALDRSVLESVGAGIPWQHEFRMVNPNGQVRWVRGSARPEVGGETGGSVWNGILVEVTGFKGLEEALHRRSALLRAVIEAGEAGILAVDHHGHVLLANGRFLTMWNLPPELLEQGRDEILLARVLEQLSEPDVFLEKVRLLYNSRETSHDHLHFQDGRVFERFSAPLLDEEDLTGRVWVFSDVTEAWRMADALRRAKAEAEAASQAKSLFLASMSHEIRTPLNIILGMAELLQDSRMDQEESGRLVALLRKNGERLLSLISDILDLTRVESGVLTLDNVSFDFYELMSEVVETVSILARGKRLAMESRMDPTIAPRLVGDPVRLRQVLLNLLGNAVKFTDKGRVELAVVRDGEEENGTVRLLFSVADSGVGIPPESREAIFDPFVQVESAPSRRVGGAGLGLSISRHLVQAMGGRMWVEPGESVGSLFCFTAQFGIGGEVAAKEETSRREMALPIGDHGQGRILLVEDTSEIAMIIQAFLRDHPLTVVLARDGREGVRRFCDGRWDLVLMDIQMPEMDGYAATRAIRAWERENGGRATPIVALTAHVTGEERNRILEAGCDDHVGKPVSKRRLLEIVERYVVLS